MKTLYVQQHCILTNKPNVSLYQSCNEISLLFKGPTFAHTEYINVKFTLEQATKVQKISRCIALLFL